MKSRPACPVIAIVGAGFSGTMVATHLLREARSALRVILIERAETAGAGIAYREQSDRHLLNVRAEGMSAFPDQPAHFLRWLADFRGDDALVNPAAFMPRRLYGQYLRDVLATAADQAQRDIRLEIVQDEVIGLSSSPLQQSLRLASGNTIEADRVVLALGNPGPADPPVEDRGFYGSPMYQSHAWSMQGLISLRRDDAVLLVGSGLTTLDWIASLAERGHRGAIHVVSRRGLLPRVHQAAAKHVLTFDPATAPPRVRALMRLIRAEIAQVIAAGGEWRSVMDALRPHGQTLWRRMSRPEQLRFLRHARTWWDIHRHRAAPRNLDTVQRLLDSGQLEVLAARPVAYAERSDAVDVHLRRRGSDEIVIRQVQRVVNCTGPDSNYRRHNHPLLNALREQGLAMVDDIGLGLETDSQGRLLQQDGSASSALFTLGPPRKGALWETTAVPEIRQQAQVLARDLLVSIEAQPGDGSGLRMPAVVLSATGT